MEALKEEKLRICIKAFIDYLGDKLEKYAAERKSRWLLEPLGLYNTFLRTMSSMAESLNAVVLQLHFFPV